MNRERNNRTQNGNGWQNGGNGDVMLTGDLMERIRALDFVKKELELYLDTHPNCKVALDYYYRTIDALDKLVEEYENKYGPITARGVVSSDNWTWIVTPWPWQRQSDVDSNWKERKE